MARFTVVWNEIALNNAASCWMSANDRAAVTAAAHAIDSELAYNPSTKGQEVREGLRVIGVPPLKAFYDVNDDDRLVHVQRVRPLGE
jgi:hypothetical protein